MKNKVVSSEWLKRAESNFEIAKRGRTSKKIFYEDLCYDCQQTAEKSIKALLIYHNIEFLKKHDIAYLLGILKNAGVEVPMIINKTQFLTEYATETRYPGNSDPVTKLEYKAALKAAALILKWVKGSIQNKQDKLF